MSKRHNRAELEGAPAQKADGVKLLLGVAVLAAGLIVYYMQAQWHQLLRVGVVLVSVLVAGYLVYLTETGRRWAQFVSETRKELRLVVWPARKDVVNTTLMIVVVVIVMGIFLWLVDMFFLWAVEWLTGRGG